MSDLGKEMLNKWSNTYKAFSPVPGRANTFDGSLKMRKRRIRAVKRLGQGHRASKWQGWDKRDGSDLKPRHLHPLPGPRLLHLCGESWTRRCAGGSMGVEDPELRCGTAASRYQLQTWEGLAEAQSAEAQTRTRMMLPWLASSALLVSHCPYPEMLF